MLIKVASITIARTREPIENISTVLPKDFLALRVISQNSGTVIRQTLRT